MQKHAFRSLTLLLLALAVTIVSAQDGECSELVAEALEFTDEYCADTERNQLCYGNLQINAEPAADVTEFKFDAPGDKIDVTSLASLNMSALQSPDTWGVALMRLQANLPNSIPGQNITMLLFGEVAVEATAGAKPEVELTVSSNANLRSGPGTSYARVGSVKGGDIVTAIGRNTANDWFQIVLADETSGWVFGDLVEASGDTLVLNEITEGFTEGGTIFGPLQAFYFTVGIGESTCAGAPADGILIQTPENAYEVELNINGVDITVGSTVFLQALPGQDMTLSVLSGAASVQNDGAGTFVPQGAKVTIPMNADGAATAPTASQPYTSTALESLPIDALDNRISVADPITAEDLASIAEGMPEPGFWDIDFTLAGGTCDVTGQYYRFNDYTKDLAVTRDGQLRCNTCDYEYEQPTPGFHVFESASRAQGYDYEYREAMHLVSPTRLEGSRSYTFVERSTGNECVIVSSFTGRRQRQ